MSSNKVALPFFSTFGDLLRYLRRRARLTQRDLSIAVGYSESQISRLETNQRPPDLTSVLALFTSALGIDDEIELKNRLLELATNGSSNPTNIRNNGQEKTVLAAIPPERVNSANPLPTGTVTFLFTDIEGSTPLWEKHPQQMAVALKIHNDVLRRAIESNGGVVFKTVGDQFQTAFPTAPQGLSAAIDGQLALRSAAWNELGQLKVRMGLHTGIAEVDSSGDEYAVSHAKNRIGRIHSIAHGGQILLSQETADLVKRLLTDGVTLNDLGEHRLKGMETLEHIYQAVVAGLEDHFPPIVSQQAIRNHMPVQLTSFIGRREELVELCLLLRKADTRLVTLTGEGGCGKTRLAVHVGDELAQEYEDGAWLAEMAPIIDPHLVVKTVASTFRLTDSDSDYFARLVDFLHPKKTLLVLDNCEHLVEESARLVDELLRNCPELRVLATSRQSLDIPGELVYRVLPLSLPPSRLGDQPTLQDIECYDAVQLFTERARSIQRTFNVNDQNAASVARICQQLDGIPLAIELAAARVNILSPAQIAARLETDPSILARNHRFGPRHQQTLQATIDWSYDLLTEAERMLLRQVSVFSGGWTLEAAEEMANTHGTADPPIIDLLAGLAKKSLINTSEAGGINRFRMLEPVRIYLRQKLSESGELQWAQDRHLDYFINLAEAAEPHLTSRNQVGWLACLEQENDNLRAALAWCLERKRTEAGLRIVGALWRYWWITANMVEGSRWCQMVLKTAGDEINQRNSQPRAKALLAYGFLLDFMSKPEEAAYVLEESLEVYRTLEDPAGMGAALCMLGVTQFGVNADRAMSLLDEGLRFSYQAEDGWWIAFNKH